MGKDNNILVQLQGIQELNFTQRTRMDKIT